MTRSAALEQFPGRFTSNRLYVATNRSFWGSFVVTIPGEARGRAIHPGRWWPVLC